MVSECIYNDAGFVGIYLITYLSVSAKATVVWGITQAYKTIAQKSLQTTCLLT